MPLIPKEVDYYLTLKRGRKNARKYLRLRKQRLRSKAVQQIRGLAFGGQSKVIRLLADLAIAPIKIQRRRPLHLAIPRVFSIIEAPEEAIALVTGFARSLRDCKRRVSRCDFDHSQMERYDLAANALLDIVAVEYRAEQRHRGARKNIRISGRFPRNAAAVRFIRALGIIRHMNVDHEALPANELPKLRVFDKRNRHYDVPSVASDAKSRTTERFVDHFNECLEACNYELTTGGRRKLSDYLGEILSNAEDHAGFVDWAIQGYLDTSIPTPVCEIAIINFGNSIAETLESLPDDSYTRRQIHDYLEPHMTKSYFSTEWRREDLLTVIALQGNVSRLNRHADDTRGQGTVDLVRFFQRVCTACNPADAAFGARMAIVSGGTYISFDGRYRMSEGDGGSIIAFNEENTLSERPDRSAVRSLGDLRFPGTIISIRFPLPSNGSSLVEEVQHGSPDDH